MMIIDNKFELGQTVYLKVDEDQNPYIVISLFIDSGGAVQYNISGKTGTRYVYDVELQEEKKIIV